MMSGSGTYQGRMLAEAIRQQQDSGQVDPFNQAFQKGIKEKYNLADALKSQKTLNTMSAPPMDATGGPGVMDYGRIA